MVFMTGTAFTLWNSDNFIPLAPFGAAGVLKGAVAAFFGFLGFDEVCVCVCAYFLCMREPTLCVLRALLSCVLVLVEGPGRGQQAGVYACHPCGTWYVGA